MPASRCWCGNEELLVFSPNYLRCPVCETLVTAEMPEANVSRVADDEQDLYGREYWLSHQENDLGFVNIAARARADLPERCVHWLRAVLKYKLPPANTLELGCAHAGFVSMLQMAGFDAAGLELSPWVVEFARQTFQVPMLLGPLEEQSLAHGTLDLIALMDVLEHLPDPLGTMAKALELLKPDGILIIQTPRYPESASYEDLVGRSDPFLEQLKANEHLYLFSQQSIGMLFERLGAAHLAFEPAIFARYDMFLAVSRAALATHSADEIAEALSVAPQGRMILSLLDLDDQRRDAQTRYAKADADRVARLEIIRQVQLRLASLDADRAARLQVIEEQRRQLAASEADRAARLQVIEEQRRQLADAEASMKNLRAQVNALTTTLSSLRQSRVYRLMRRLGRWSWIDQKIALPSPAVNGIPGPERVDRPSGLAASGLARRLRRVAVDLTPVLPGGDNGGAKLVAIGLIQQLSRVAPECEFVLLTSEKNYAELASLDTANVRRVCVTRQPAAPDPAISRAVRLQSRVRGLARRLPPSVKNRLKINYQKLIDRPGQSGLLRSLGADLLFCPFTAPLYFDPSIPLVSVVHDIQHLYYPQFFTTFERFSRDRDYRQACRLASRVVCVSDYVRGTVLEQSNLTPERVKTVHTRLFHRIEPATPERMARALSEFGLVADQFLLYPANFWAHKNHEMLLAGFGIYRHSHPESELKLVCTGAPGQRMETLREAASRMGLHDRVLFPGFLPDGDFAALLSGCKAVIFPSLYEGFGMPVLEAMAFGKPVLCGDVASLPEIVGDAAVLFDPRRPQAIACAVERIEREPDLDPQLIQKGRERLAAFGEPLDMAKQYLDIFYEALSSEPTYSHSLQGVFPDGWIGDRAVVTFGQGSEARYLETVLRAPAWLPPEHLSVQFVPSGNGVVETHQIRRGATVTIRRPIAQSAGYVEMLIDPVFQPKSLGVNADERQIGCKCTSFRIVDSGGSVELLETR